MRTKNRSLGVTSAFGCNDSRSVKSLASRSEPNRRLSWTGCAVGVRNGTVREAIASPDVLRCDHARDARSAQADAADVLMNSRRSTDGGRAKLTRRDYSLSRVMDKNTRDISLVALVTAIGVVAVSNTGVYSVAGDARQTRSSVQEQALTEIVAAPVTLRDGIGIVREHVTTASSEAGAFYNQGVAYLHSFVWIEAARSFNQALRLDPNLAMADVGLSYALGEACRPTRARRVRAQRLVPLVSPREAISIELPKNNWTRPASPNQTVLRAGLPANTPQSCRSISRRCRAVADRRTSSGFIA